MTHGAYRPGQPRPFDHLVNNHLVRGPLTTANVKISVWAVPLSCGVDTYVGYSISLVYHGINAISSVRAVQPVLYGQGQGTTASMPMPLLHTVPSRDHPDWRTNSLCRKYQLLLTDIVARPSANEWIFTRFLDCPASQNCNRLQEPVNSPSSPDRDNRVEPSNSSPRMPGTA